MDRKIFVMDKKIDRIDEKVDRVDDKVDHISGELTNSINLNSRYIDQSFRRISELQV